MSEDQQNWITWARTLQRWGMKETAASVLDSAGSLGMLIAPLLYIGQPLLSGAVSPHTLDALAQVLEDPENRRKFVSFLRETPSSGTSA
jgi:hypothetical protein